MSKANGVGLIDLQIMWNRLIAVVEEQAQTLMRTAFSPIVRECGDLSAGVFDLKGRMLAQAVTGTPGHVNSMAESVKHFIAHFPLETMKRGRRLHHQRSRGWAPAISTTSSSPRRASRTASWSRCSPAPATSWTSAASASAPTRTDVFMEGLYIPMLKLIDQGDVNETLMAMIRANTRLPVDTEGDVYSLAACNDVGARRLVEMMDEFGIDTLDELGDHIIATARARPCWPRSPSCRRAPGATSMTVDGYDEPVTLAATLTDLRRRHPCRFRRHLGRCRSSASTCRCPTPRPTPCSASAASSPRRSRTMPARSRR